MNKVLKTVLHLSLLFIGPTVALMLAHRWPTGGPPVAHLACHMPTVPLTLAQRWPNSGMTTVACHFGQWANVGPLAKMTLAHRWLPTVAQWWSHRWPNVGPPVAQQWHANSGMSLLGQRWPTGQNYVGPPVAANGGATGGPTLGHRGHALWCPIGFTTHSADMILPG